MTHREKPSKTNTSANLYDSSSEGIHIKEPQKTHNFRPETYTVLAFIFLGFKTNYCSFAKHFAINTKNYPHFHYYATFLFKTPLSTLQYASVNHTLYGKCLMLPQLN